MKTIPLLLATSLLLLAQGIQAAKARTLWEIGRPDNDTAEFALAPANYLAFPGLFGSPDDLYFIGHSNPREHWPYVLGTSSMPMPANHLMKRCGRPEGGFDGAARSAAGPVRAVGREGAFRSGAHVSASTLGGIDQQRVRGIRPRRGAALLDWNQSSKSPVATV